MTGAFCGTSRALLPKRRGNHTGSKHSHSDSARDLTGSGLLKDGFDFGIERLPSFLYPSPPAGYAPLQRAVSYEDAPAFMQTNPSLKTGYRVGGTHLQNLRSGFLELHNETLNVWTLVISFLFSVCALYNALQVERVPFPHAWTFLAFAAHCLFHHPFAILYHCFSPISAEVYNFWRKMDICMIFFMSVPLTYSLCSFVFGPVGTAALTFMSAAAGITGSTGIIALRPGQVFDKGRHAACLAAAGMCYVTPLVAGAGGPGVGTWAPVVAVAGLVGGGLVYATEWPECVLGPSLADVWANSHALMHVCVVTSHVAEYIFLLHKYRSQVAEGAVVEPITVE